MRLTALWWWIDRWRKSSAYMDMTLEEQGAYRNLLDEAHLRGGPLPNDERILAKACGDALAWSRVRANVMSRFELGPDGWHNGTLDAVFAQSLRRAVNQANYRHRNNGGDNAGDNKGLNKPASPSPSPSPIPGSGKEKEGAPRPSLSDAARDPFTDKAITERAGRFIDRYAELYPTHRHGARYAVRETRDYQAAVKLCQTWTDDARLEKLAICFLTTDHKFAEEGSRTIPQFLALASWVDGELSKWEQTHARQA